jgi:hypothetical protein
VQDPLCRSPCAGALVASLPPPCLPYTGFLARFPCHPPAHMRAGGHLAEHDPDKAPVVPWALPEGDKSWIQLATAKDDDEEKLENNKEGQMKCISGTLYAIARGLEKKREHDHIWEIWCVLEKRDNARLNLTVKAQDCEGRPIPTQCGSLVIFGTTGDEDNYYPGNAAAHIHAFLEVLRARASWGPAMTAWRMKWDLPPPPPPPPPRSSASPSPSSSSKQRRAQPPRQEAHAAVAPGHQSSV